MEKIRYSEKKDSIRDNIPLPPTLDDFYDLDSDIPEPPTLKDFYIDPGIEIPVQEDCSDLQSEVNMAVSDDEVETDLDKTDEYSDAEEKEILSEEEIRNFIVNKDLYKCDPLCTEPETFDEFLYYYKSFHSPLLDKEFHGFSMEKIQSESRKIERRKRE